MQGFRWFAARAKEIVVNTPSRSVEQSVERSTKIAKVLARRMRVAQDRFNERLTSAAKGKRWLTWSKRLSRRLVW